MNRKEIFDVWAPFGKKWTDWVKPVPFIGLDDDKTYRELIDYTIPNIEYLTDSLNDAAIILDIDTVNSVKEGIALAKLGYRPIPVFNGTNPSGYAFSNVDNLVVEPMLIWGAEQLKNIEISDDALPVFLLDSNRLNRYKEDRGVFDNSWDLYHQDIPSFNWFKKNNVSKIIVRGNKKLNIDLQRIFYKFQKNDIEIYFTNGYEAPKIINVKKPRKKSDQ